MNVRCPSCHESMHVPGEQSLGDLQCISCGNGFSLLGDETLPPAEREERQIGHFRLVRRLGAGAFGSVWLARDQELDRPVALKMPRKGELSPQEAEQFLREARAAAQLKHPNIVAVHEVGREKEQVYIVSDYVPGQSLDAWLKDRRLPPARAAELAAKIAEALEHAHTAGVIHRDLKPGNILLDERGEPHITDFGLARRERVDITMTADGSPLGTPAYMSPEQARGDAHRADRRTDVYSLGVILYELATGELPFRGNVRMMLHQVLHEDPPAPRKLDPHVPRDLETICLKCIEKEPAKRYGSAGEVAAELRRFLAGEPIHARPAGRAERAWRWCRRKPALATASALALAGLLAAVVISGLFAVSQARSAHRLAAEQALTAEALLHSQLLSAELALDKGQLLGEQGDVNLALLWMARALALAPAEATDLKHAIRVNLAAWSQQAVQLEEVLPAAGGGEVAISGDGGRLLIATSEGVVLHVRLLEVATGEVVAQFEHTGELMPERALSATPDLSRLLVGYRSGAVRLFDVERGVPVWEIEKPQAITSARVHPRGDVALIGWARGPTAEEGAVLQLHDLTTGEAAGPTLEFDLPPWTLAFTPDGGRFAVGSFVWADDRSPGLIQVLNMDGSEWCPPIAPESGALSLGFSPDGRQLLVGHFDFSVRLWNLEEGQEAVAGVGWSQEAPVSAAAFVPQAGVRMAVTGCFDGTARLWDLATGAQVGPALRHEVLVYTLALRPGISGLVTASVADVRVWRLPELERDERPVVPIEIDPAGRLLASSDDEHRVTLHDVAGGAPLGPALAHDGPVHLSRGAARHDGTLAFTVGHDTVGRIWNTATGRSSAAVGNHTYFGAFSPDGRHLLTGHFSHARLWDVSSSQELRRLTHLPRGPVFSGEFSFDGALIVTGAVDSSARLWDAATGAQLAIFPHITAVFSVCFSPDARLVGVGGHDGTRLWDVATHEPAGPLLAHSGSVVSVRFSPDGRLLLTGGLDGVARLWDVATFRPLGPPVRHLAGIGRVGFMPDGATVWAAPGDHFRLVREEEVHLRRAQQPGTHFWTLTDPVEGEPPEVRRWVEAITGMALDENGGVIVLQADAWRERREAAAGAVAPGG